ncbi:cytochrome P450 81D1-like [Cynara cardunculus var. scolymus]|uniref:Cytochrome P450 n=1 Tax=Cynara cardunculus var. scolymus TaxID=59895 RepID=A0A103XWQ0_CYNCS|nr:cytochrome P450 81D1-like [Cynara cardunculus var. scolymus]KVH98298.1 cytochrome P450 [Cynara cardunculus var. scolymus]
MEGLHLYLLLLILACSLFNKYVVPKIKNLPPTPLSALTVIGYLCFFKQPIHRTLAQIASRHGSILLLHFGCRRVLLISSSSAAEELFTKNDAAFANRPKLLPGKVFGHNYTNLAWAPHGALWCHLRRVSLLEILPFHRLPAQNESCTEEVRLLLGRLFHSEEKVIELKPMFLNLVLDVMMRMFAGKRYCTKKMAEGDVTQPISLLDYVTRSFRMTTGEPDVGYFMPILKLLGLRGLEQRCNDLQKKGDLLMDSIIHELKTRMLGSGEKEDKVIEFLLARQQDDPKLYPDEMIKGLVLVLTSAGTETSAGIMEWAFSLLLNHPEVLHKAQNEIENYVRNDRFLQPSDIEHLPYLSCIVKETLRMYPVAPLLVPHESSKECTISGYNVPKGTMLILNVWAIHHDPKIWDEPMKFKPERFEKVTGKRDAFKLMPFGYGRRSCPGKHMAVRVISLALGSLIHCFDWERVSEKKVDLTEETGLSLLKAQPLMAVCHPRSTMVNLLSEI